MRKLLYVLAGLGIALSVAWAADKEAIKQKTCPVSGKPINEEKSVEHEGQKVYFCCGGCPKAFEKAPMKYLPAVYKQIYPQQVQTKCPMSGKPIDATKHTELKGQTVYFCCGGCLKKAEADPDAALSKMKESSITQVHCPVSGKAINREVSAEVSGKTVYFCCEGCVKAAKEDAKKAEAALTPEVGVVAYGATAKDDLVLCAACASDGRTIPIHRAKAKTVEHEGKRYFVASDGCAKHFNAETMKCTAAVQKALKADEAKQQ